MRRLGLATLVAGLLAAAAPAAAGAAPRLQPLGTFDTPVGIAAPPGDSSRVMVVEKGGTVRMLRDGVKVEQPFLDLTSITSSSASERGLLSIAFPPDYQQSGLFYVFLTARDPLGQIQIRELHRADADHAAPGTGRIVFSASHGAPNHNGGQLQFGPDGLLWFTIGDDADSSNAQDATNFYGKVSRIDPRVAGAQAAVWASGLRNPWRFSFDRATHDLWIGDVGDVTYEEIDHAAYPGLGQGANYGWPCREGLHSHPGTCTLGPLTEPVVEQTHADGWSAIIGGYVVRDPGLPTLAGRYLYGDLSHAAMRVYDPATRTDADAGLSVDGLTTLGEDPCGRLYTAAYGGTVSRIVDGTPSACSFPTTPPPSTPTTSPPADTTAPRVSIHVRGLRRVVARRALLLRIRCDERCRLTARGRVPGVARFRETHRTLAAGKRTTVRLRLSRPAARTLRRAINRRGSVRARLQVRATDTAGNERTRSRRVRIRHQV